MFKDLVARSHVHLWVGWWKAGRLARWFQYLIILLKEMENFWQKKKQHSKSKKERNHSINTFISDFNNSSPVYYASVYRMNVICHFGVVRRECWDNFITFFAAYKVRSMRKIIQHRRNHLIHTPEKGLSVGASTHTKSDGGWVLKVSITLNCSHEIQWHIIIII